MEATTLTCGHVLCRDCAAVTLHVYAVADAEPECPMRGCRAAVPEAIGAGATEADPDVSQWDVGKVWTMGTMFFQAGNANPDVSQWDVSQVVTMAHMFRGGSSAIPNVALGVGVPSHICRNCPPIVGRYLSMIYAVHIDIRVCHYTVHIYIPP